MKKSIFTAIVFLFVLNSFGQAKFEEGYFIDNQNKKTFCLIKNDFLKNNPSKFTFKLNESSTPKELTFKTIKEFGIGKQIKFIRKKVKIDKSSDDLNNLSNERNPIFKEETIFLKSLVEGDANLYLYREGNLIRYFYNLKNTEIEQLVYKKYLKSNNDIATNYYFRQQLYKNLKCEENKRKKTETLDYNQKSLMFFFTEYNLCKNNNSRSFSKKTNYHFNFNIRPRLNSSSLEIKNYSSSFRDTEFDNKFSFSMGFEFELIFPFNDYRWSVIVEPTYQSYKTEKTITTAVYETGGGILNNKVNYESVEIPIGLRYYLKNNKSSKFYINGSFILELNRNSSFIESKRLDGSIFGETLKTDSPVNFAFGVGYKILNKYSIELRQQTTRNILFKKTDWQSEYNTISIIFGYTLF